MADSMTDTPHIHALAMRTAAAAVVYPTILDTALSADLTANILALPLEADHAALLAEAVRLPEIAALIEALTPFAEYMAEDGARLDCDHKGNPLLDSDAVGRIYLKYRDFRRAEAALQPFLALETP